MHPDTTTTTINTITTKDLVIRLKLSGNVEGYVKMQVVNWLYLQYLRNGLGY